LHPKGRLEPAHFGIRSAPENLDAHRPDLPDIFGVTEANDVRYVPAMIGRLNDLGNLEVMAAILAEQPSYSVVDHSILDDMAIERRHHV
jgi:hypothetical protein